MNSASKVVNYIRSMSPIKAVQDILSRNSSLQKHTTNNNNNNPISIINGYQNSAKSNSTNTITQCNNTISEQQNESQITNNIVNSVDKTSSCIDKQSQQLLQQLSIDRKYSNDGSIQTVDNIHGIRNNDGGVVQQYDSKQQNMLKELIDQQSLLGSNRKDSLGSDLKQSLANSHHKMVQQNQIDKENEQKKESMKGSKNIKLRVNGRTCKICGDGLLNQKGIKTLVCTHKFHEKCISRISRKNMECPVCNSQRQFTMKLTN